MTDQILLGQNEYNEVYFAEIRDGKIRGFNGHYIIDPSNTYDGNRYLENSSWTHNVTINGVEYKSGTVLAKDFTPFFTDEETKRIILDEDYYVGGGAYCEECGTFHDTEQYYDISYVILNDCELYCKSCVKADALLVEVGEADDIYKAKDIVGMEIADYEEVHTIFHGCGWGGHASTYSQAETIVNDLLEEHGELYAGLTGIGQFQVYVTLYKRAA